MLTGEYLMVAVLFDLVLYYDTPCPSWWLGIYCNKSEDWTVRDVSRC